MATLEQEIIHKFHQLDKHAQRRVWALIDQEIEQEETSENEAVDALGWPIGFFEETYGSMADDPMDEIDNTHLPSPIRDEIE